MDSGTLQKRAKDTEIYFERLMCGTGSVLECSVHFLSEKRSKPYMKYGAASIAGEKCAECQEVSRVSGSAGKQADWYRGCDL